jgi:alpha/beta superfamily hydrolase
MMDSHIFKKAANRLPAMADISVIRFNTRGTESERGRSEGEFGNGITEKFDVEAAIEYCFTQLRADTLWIVGWSFGTDLALQHATDKRVSGLILLSPPLLTTTNEQLDFWNKDGRPVIALVPEYDEFLNPDQAKKRFAPLKSIELVPVDGAKHLWVGEPFVARVLTEIVRLVNPGKLPLPTEF